MIPKRPQRIEAPRSDFERRAETALPGVHRAEDLSALMVNVGLRCNLACEFCHQSSSPDRTEAMSRGTMLDVLHFADDIRPQLIDVTGGEPVLWPLLREFVMLAAEVAPRTRVRTNLDVLLLPEVANVAPMLAENRVEILASLPEALECRTIGGCIEALCRLTELGYGDPERGAQAALDLAYNPLPGEMPRPQAEIEAEFRSALSPHGVTFRSLIAITNVALGGFARWLDESNDRERYRVELRDAFNPEVLPLLACRHGIEIAWDGTLWDCDFNLAAGTLLSDETRHVGEYVGSQVGQLALATRRISFAEHCFACAAGAGSG